MLKNTWNNLVKDKKTITNKTGSTRWERPQSTRRTARIVMWYNGQPVRMSVDDWIRGH